MSLSMQLTEVAMSALVSAMFCHSKENRGGHSRPPEVGLKFPKWCGWFKGIRMNGLDWREIIEKSTGL